MLHEFPFGRGGTWDRPGRGGGGGGGDEGAEEAGKQEETGAASPVMNGRLTNGYR